MLFIPSYRCIYPLNHDGAMKNIILDAALDSNYKILQTDRRSHEQGDVNLFLFNVLCDEYEHTLSEILVKDVK